MNLKYFQRKLIKRKEFSKYLASRGTQIDENQIQKWLNHKFPKGFSKLEKSLERLDTKQMGTVKLFN